MSKWLFVLFTGKMACTLYDQKNTRFEDISSTIEWITIRFSLPLFIFPAPIFSYIQYYALHAGESSFFLAIPQMLVIFISLGVEQTSLVTKKSILSQKFSFATKNSPVSQKLSFVTHKITGVTKILFCHKKNCHTLVTRKFSLVTKKKSL